MNHWPQLLILAFGVFGFAIHCSKAGEPRGAYDPIPFLIGLGIETWVLYQGGFFAPLGWLP